MNTLFQDLKLATRHFYAEPLFALVLVLTLALGIGPNAIIFTVLDSIYFKPLPYPRQQNLALLSEVNLASGDLLGCNPHTFNQLQKHSRTLQAAAAYRSSGFHLNLDSRPEAFPGQYVSDAFFRVLGVSPSLGRGFQPADFRTGAPQVVVLSHGLWSGYFSGRSDIVGLQIRVNGTQATVVGVMPPEFRSFMEGRVARLWMPHVPILTDKPQMLESTGVIARLRPEISVEQARAELESTLADLKTQFPDFFRQRGASVRDFRSSQHTGIGPGLTMLCVMVGLVLLIACGNAANLLLVRAAARAREMGIRIALGASRARLMRQMLTETLLFSVAGGAVGLLLAFWGIDFIWAQTGAIFLAIGAEPFRIDRRILVFTLALSIITSIVFGLLPALRCSHVRPSAVIKAGDLAGASPGRRHRLNRALVVFQVALCTVCLLGTALMIKSFLQFARLSGDPGFRTERLLVGSMPFQKGTAAAKWRALCGELRTRVGGQPGIRRTALTDRLPLLDGGAGVTFVKEDPGTATPGSHDKITASAQLVSSGFFEIFEIPVLRGRPISDQDDEGTPPVIVINETLARAYWKDSDPIGKRILLGEQWRTIVGIVSNPVRESPLSPLPKQVYMPYLQRPPAAMKMVVDSALDPAEIIPVLRRQLEVLNPDQPLMDVTTLESAFNRFLTPFRFILWLMISFGIIALGLAGVGLYGVISQVVAERTRELGIRGALGATPRNITSTILMLGMRITGFGLVIGLFLGSLLVKVLPNQILGVGALSPLNFVMIPLFIACLSILACLIPSRRAASIDPMEALRHE